MPRVTQQVDVGLSWNTGLYSPLLGPWVSPGLSSQTPVTGASPARAVSSVTREAGPLLPFLLCVHSGSRPQSLDLGEFGSGHPGGG